MNLSQAYINEVFVEHALGIHSRTNTPLPIGELSNTSQETAYLGLEVEQYLLFYSVGGLGWVKKG